MVRFKPGLEGLWMLKGKIIVGKERGVSSLCFWSRAWQSGAVTFVTDGEPVGVIDMRVFDSGLS